MMNEEQDIHKQPSSPDMLNSDSQNTDKDDDSLASGLTDEEKESYVMLAKMARMRHKTPCPDVDETWKQFSRQQVQTSGRTHAYKWQIALAALSGAAAMLVGILLYNHFTSSSSSVESQHVIAMNYDETRQQVLLQNDSELLDISLQDSLSFQSVTQSQSEHAVSTSMKNEKDEGKIQKLSTPRGMDFKVILSDGSEVWLNAESSLEFPSAFTSKERRVNLKGEAYFKVARNEECPFIVTTDKMQVRVLGTEFNFRSYVSELSHVSLVSGSVEVYTPDGKTPEVTLKPGQDACLDSSGQIQVREIDTYSVCQWVNGFFYFDNSPLVDILRELGRWYNLGVIFRSSSQMEQKMHFSASRSDDISRTLENLNRLRKVHVSLEGNNLVVDKY